MRTVVLILITISIIIGACSSNEQIDKDFISKYWNLKIDKNDSNLSRYKDQAFYFENGVAYFNSGIIAHYSVSNDTLIICDTSYYDKWIIDNGISSSGKVDIRFEKSIKNDSLYRVTYKYLVGKIIKATADSLVIRIIEGYGFPFKYNGIYRFYNDTLLYDTHIAVDTIEFSSSLCYGSCPAIAFKIDKGLDLNFWGGIYSDKQGFYKGKISQSEFDKFERSIRIADIEKIDTVNYPPADAPFVEILIDYNHNKTKRFWGYLWQFPPRIRNIGLDMFNLYETASLDSCDTKISFDVQLYIPEERIPPPPPPPGTSGMVKVLIKDYNENP